jgi:hypothetical protein
MNTVRSWIALIAGTVAAGGCAPLSTVDSDAQPVEKPAPPRAESPAVQITARPSIPVTSDAENLLAYYQQMRTLSGSDLGREHEIARKAYARSRTEFNRVRFAMMLSLPNTPFNDNGRALELLEPISRNPNGQLHGLAVLLVAHLQERRRLDSSVQGLQKKLDALKSLERSMIERTR